MISCQAELPTRESASVPGQAARARRPVTSRQRGRSARRTRRVDRSSTRDTLAHETDDVVAVWGFEATTWRDRAGVGRKWRRMGWPLCAAFDQLVVVRRRPGRAAIRRPLCSLRLSVTGGRASRCGNGGVGDRYALASGRSPRVGGWEGQLACKPEKRPAAVRPPEPLGYPGGAGQT